MSDTISLWGILVPSVLASAVGALTSLLVKHQLAMDIKAIEGRQQRDGEAFRLAHSPRVTAAIKLWAAFCEFERATTTAVNPFAPVHEPATGTREEKDAAMSKQRTTHTAETLKRSVAAWNHLKGTRDEAECLIDQATFAKFSELFSQVELAFGDVLAARLADDDKMLAKAISEAMARMDEVRAKRGEVVAAIRLAIAGGPQAPSSS